MLTNHPTYVAWATKTMEQGDCCHRLTRFATWAQQEKIKPQHPPPAIKTGATEGKPGSTTGPGLQETQAMMMKVIEAVTALKNDVESLKEERPRKKKESEDSFSMVSENAP